MQRISGITIARLVLFAAALWLAAIYLPKSSFFPRSAYGPILHEENSDFSTIRVRGKGSNRHLLFVSAYGREQQQSSVDLAHPGELQVAYTRFLFATLLFKHPQKRVLLIGLGGGGMTHFIQKRLPNTSVEAVEIDPAVVRIAAEYFETTESPKLRIHTEDAFLFLAQKREPYDAIYLDAFLRPSVDRDANGKTARLKTIEFLRTMSDQLTPDGLLACNLIPSRATTAGDLFALRKVFPTVIELPVPGTGNLVTIASKQKIAFSKDDIISRGTALESSLPIGLPFTTFAKRMKDSSGK